jgi:GT2 family glycosyltransferase/glycosyltransferase involved in cell wall biosynthesis
MAVQPRRALLAQIRHPTPDRDGGSSRTLDLVDALLGLGFQVTFCALAPEAGWERYARLLQQSGVEVRNGIDSVTDELSRGDFSVAVMTFWPAAEALAPVVARLAPETAIVVHSGDLHFVRMARRAAVAGAPLDEATGVDFSRELNAYLLADRVIMVSEDEARTAALLVGDPRRFVVVPLSEPPSPPLPQHERRGVLFVGNFRHIPNLEAALYLCDAVLPHVDPRTLARHPLTVVGNGLDEPWYAEVKAAVSRFPGVRLPGWVPDVGPYVRRARVSVAPLLHGAGVKGKILTSLAAGTPVVTTPVGVEGLDHGVVRAASVVEGAFALAEAVERLLTDDDHWAARAAPGPAAVAAAHSRLLVLLRLAEVLEEAIATAGQNRPEPGALTSFAAGAHREMARLRRAVGEELAGAVISVTPPGGEVLVIADGDEGLPAIPGRTTREFPDPEACDGERRPPVDGAAAVAHLRALVDRGARHLVVPAPSLAWLHRYPELAVFLDRDGGACVLRSELGRVYRLPPILPPRSRIVAAVPSEMVATLAAVPPATCSVEARPWSGAGPPPLADVDGADLVVAVRPGAELPHGFWDGLAAAARRVPFDVLQPALAVGGDGPPAYVAQAGVLGRGMPVLPGAPVLAARRPLAGWLAGLPPAGRPIPAAPGRTTAVLDAAPVGLDAARARQLRDATPAADVGLDAVVTRSGAVHEVPRRDRRPEISVVVATYRRPQLLDRCLAGFAAQEARPGSFEVVVVDDGSGGRAGEATAEVIERHRHRLPITVVRIDHAGRSAAKNIGILAAQADLVLLFDDDDVATPTLVEAHLAKHRDHPEPELAVLGRTTWAPELPVSPVMHHVTEVGMLLFSYPRISADELLDFRYFWEGRISCKRAFLLANGLHDQRLAYTIDIELSHRLDAAGLKVMYVPEALSHMARPVTFGDFAQRCVAKGRAARQFSQLHPTPEVRAYCHIDEAEEAYPALAAGLDADIERLVVLEERAGPVRSAAPTEVMVELDRLYSRVFRAHTYRGIVEAASYRPGWPVLSVVVPVWSVSEDLADVAARTVERLWSVARVATEVIVVDNGSPHRRDLRATTVIRWPENRGVAPAWNAGLAAARGDVLAVLNSDVLVEPGWDEALVEAASTGHRIAFPFTDHCDGLGPRRPDKAGTAGWCFALSRRLFAELGAFDEQFAPAYWEDTDYWHRAFVAGVALVPVPAAQVQHARRTTARHLPGFEEVFERNRRRYEHKHGLGHEEAPPYWHRPVEDHVPEGDGDPG